MKKISAFVILVYIAFWSSVSFAQMEPNETLPIDPDVVIGTLPNGLKYYIKKNQKPEKRAELRLAVKIGSIMEDDDQQGLAHFLEHMCFNGTKRFPKQDLVNFLESVGIRFGAHLNAYTSFDETVYMLQVPTDKPDVFGKAFDVLEDWAGSVALDDAEIDKERGVVVEEWRLGRGAYERVSNKLLPSVLYNSRYANRLPIGKKEVLDTFKYETVRRMYKDWYRPDLMGVMAVGDFDVKQVEEMIKTRFGRLVNPSPSRPRTEYEIPSHTDAIYAVTSDKELPMANVDIYFKYDDRPEVSINDYRKRLVGDLYDAMLNNRLQEISMKPDAAFAQAYCYDETFMGGKRAFTISVAPKNESLSKGYESVLQEVMRVRQKGFTQTELEREKKNILTAIERQYNERNKTESRAVIGEFVRNFIDKEPMPGIAYEFELYKKYVPLITLSEINALNDVRMGPKTSRVVTLAGPQKDEIRIPSEQELRNIFSRVENSSLDAYNDKVTDLPLLAAKPKPGKVTATKVRKSIGVTEWTLSNGMKVVLKPTDFKNDEILFSASSPGGSSLASDDNYLSADMCAQIMQMGGVANFDMIALQKYLAGKRVSVSPSVSSLQEGFNGSASPKDIETAFQLIYAYSTAPRKDTAAFGSIVARMKTFLDNKTASPESAFQDTFAVTMANYHYRARPMSSALLQEISLDKAYMFYLDRFSDMGDFTFYFVGNFDLKTMKPLVETYLASLPTKKRKESWKDIGITPPQGLVEKIVKKGIEPKSSVRMAQTGNFVWSGENRFYLNAMAEVLSIKLRETLREEKGGVYGVGCRATPTHYPKQMYTLSIGFGCAPDRVDELVQEVYKKLDTMVMKAPEAIYVNKVKEIAKRENETNLKENRYWLSSLSSAYVNGEDPEGITKRDKLIESMTPEKVWDAAKKYCVKGNMVKVVLYPEK
jgi:zinc protease